MKLFVNNILRHKFKNKLNSKNDGEDMKIFFEFVMAPVLGGSRSRQKDLAGPVGFYNIFGQPSYGMQNSKG